LPQRNPESRGVHQSSYRLVASPWSAHRADARLGLAGPSTGTLADMTSARSRGRGSSDRATDDRSSRSSIGPAIVGLSRLAERALDQIDLTVVQYRILRFAEQPGSVQSDLTFYLAVSKQSMTRLVDPLVERGYIVRRVDPGDRRRVIHEITPAGRDALRRADAELERSLRMVLQDLESDELEAVESGLIVFRTGAAKSMDRVTADRISQDRLAYLFGTAPISGPVPAPDLT
jgi:DNA-binding MarR family transcriptional regulator